MHVDANSHDVTEKSVNGLAPYETFRWSVVRAPGIWVIMGFNVFLGPYRITALNVKEVPSFKKHSFIALGVDHLPL